MSKPIILAVDDEPEVLNSIRRDLRQHYSESYRVMKAASGSQALEAVQELKRRGTPVALFVADQRMPGMSGTDFLIEALKLYPDARRVLLTAWADTDAAITAINEIALDHYLLKPWEPPTERLYPVLDDLLSDWSARIRPEQDGIRVVGTTLSPRSYAIRDFLSGNQVPYRWIDYDSDAPARELVASASDGAPRLPVVLLPDGSALVQPDTRTLAQRIGLQTEAKHDFYDVIIVGGGPAGLAGAVYAASEGLRAVLVERNAPGGQAGTSSRIENYLGFPSGLTGADLSRRAATQAKRFGAELLSAREVVGVKRSDPYRTVELADGTALTGYAILYAAGMAVRSLEVPGIEPLVGAGVYYGAALTEAAAIRGRDIFVIGGANSAGQGALFFSRYARKVTVLVRGSGLHAMSRYLTDRIDETPNIELLTHTQVVNVSGETRLETLTLENTESGERRTVPADALFIFIGTSPHTEMLADLVACDAEGFVLTGRDTMPDATRPTDWHADRDPFPFETSVPGIFAAGDVRHGSGKRVASAVGDGSAAIGMIHRYLESV